MARLHLVRHGETDWNVQKRYQGSQDIPLNERGRLQAAEVANQLKEISFAGIYSSHLKRAFETAEIIRGTRPLQVVQYPELKEGFYASLEGKTFLEIEEQFGFLAAHAELSNVEKLHFKIIPEMESGYEVTQRTLPILKLIAQKHLGEDVLIVTHGGVIRALLVYLANHDWTTTKIHNGQVVTFFYEEDCLKILS
ncbi:MAG: histidine phosphatase family protein [Verrucomicrobia bacterium]|nr:histidine phosphatase family protein [Verrucomicrobiota bacterium]